MAMDPCVKETLSSRTREDFRKNNNRFIFQAGVRWPTDKTFPEGYDHKGELDFICLRVDSILPI
jgi:hypothetical protein